MEQKELALKIASLLDNKKGKEITILEIGPLSNLGDYFVIASGSSAPQIQAMVGEVEEKLAKEGCFPRHKEGVTAANWVLMDYGDVIVHVFHQETREFYGIERLWADAPKVAFTPAESV